VCCLGDIHYAGGRRVLEELAEGLEEECVDADVVAVVGDLTADGDLAKAREVLETITEALRGVPVLVVPGNHDIYLGPEEVGAGMNSLMKLSAFNSLVEELGCIALMRRPIALGSTGFVGSMGWYDYSYAPTWLGLPLEAFREKAFGLYIWADRDYVRLPMSDEEFATLLASELERSIESIEKDVETIVAVLHHVPFRELVHYRLEPSWDYFSTFMGSQALGNVIERHSKIRTVLYGHSHNGVDTRTCRHVKGIKCCNCASPHPLAIELDTT